MAGGLTGRTIILTDEPVTSPWEGPGGWTALNHVSIRRCDPLKPESWTGCFADVLIACISEDTANNAVVREILRGQGARVYVRVE